MSDYASAAGHWYQQDGTPAYTIVGKNGNERPTTLRDARKLGLVPSVTGIIRMMAAPGLENWKSEQLLMSALTTPRGNLSEKEWISAIRKSAGEQAAQAAERGTEIHAAIELAYQSCIYDSSTIEYVTPTMLAIEEAFGQQDWSAERSFASPLGYGGKLDLHCDTVLLDIKTKSFANDNKDDLHFDEHVMQLAAYRQGLSFRNPREVVCGNVFVSRTHPGAVRIHIWSEEELQRGLEMFNNCLALWKLRNRI